MLIGFPVRNPELKTKLLPDGHVVVFNDRTLWAHILSPCGAAIWEFCDGRHNLDSILDELESLTGSRPPAQETEKFLADLVTSGLVVNNGKSYGLE